MPRSEKYQTVTDNLVAIFGERKHGTHERLAKMGRSRVKLVVQNSNHADLLVWTDSPCRATQDVVSRIDLREPDAMAQITQAGIVLA
jgi:hypothetical protein